MLGRGNARIKTRKARMCSANAKVSQPVGYRKAGIGSSGTPDDSRRVNVHGAFPTRWITAGMTLLNLVVWLNAALQLAP